MSGELIKAFELKRFDGVANEVAFSRIKESMLNCKRIDLIPKDKIVKLNIRWGELYCKCSEEEWLDLYRILDNSGIKINKTSVFVLFQNMRWFKK